MVLQWNVRKHMELPPRYPPDVPYFTIRVHRINRSCDHSIMGYIDYCSADLISRVELLSMGKEIGIDVDNYQIFWNESDNNLVQKAINNDVDAFGMALRAEKNNDVNVYFIIKTDDVLDGNVEAQTEPISGSVVSQILNIEGPASGNEEPINVNTGNDNLEGEVQEDDIDLLDSDYSFISDEDINKDDYLFEKFVDAGVERDMIVLGEPEGCGNVDEGSDSSEYAGSDKLYSCSDSEEEGEVAYKPRFEEFNEDTDMDDIHFAIGMQFSSFDQFKKVVRHYGIKHRYVINFRPNTKKRCKAFCKRQCPFYLWASLMSGDKETVQIKTGILEHSCVRDHNIRHINPTWIAHHYLEQFRADPTWKLDGIVQAVKALTFSLLSLGQKE
ncbi:uncharacterized protein LOC126682066 [Mercurialis annua]|uniref:uncharacterized protein LOC126682066 n=1 Tax=Mercurialis annua TaxID=3986 RepID=UPI00215F034E|nr:uncharacterized protein LOC126682066 [Mercurialis annua]